jgi:hypothetical protein
MENYMCWITAKHAFLSIVLDHDNPDHLLVRGRVEGDIEHYWPDVAVLESAGSDYRFRASIPRRDVIITIARIVFDIDYFNFKSSVPDKRRSLHYASVWGIMADLQDDLR